MHLIPRRLLLRGAASALAAPALARADAWPNRPIRCIVPFPPGGGTDATARIVTRRLSEALGVAVVIENRPGAGGTIGGEAVARAVPDGYTTGIATSSSHPVSTVLRRDVPYDPVTSFSPITQIGSTSFVLVGGPAARAQNLSEFIAVARANPGTVQYASVGVSTLGYLLTRHFEQLTGLQMGHVPYRGAAQVYPDLMNGTVAVILDNPSGSAGLIRDGKLTAFAITRRSPLLPDVPTFESLGVRGFDAVFWYGLVAPAGLSPAIARRMQEALAAYFLTDAGRPELRAVDVEPVMSTPEEFGRTIAEDARIWREAATRLNIQPE
jgi:tripartite-type tricarboxylate transporter receptor subunit TctC